MERGRHLASCTFGPNDNELRRRLAQRWPQATPQAEALAFLDSARADAVSSSLVARAHRRVRVQADHGGGQLPRVRLWLQTDVRNRTSFLCTLCGRGACAGLRSTVHAFLVACSCLLPFRAGSKTRVLEVHAPKRPSPCSAHRCAALIDVQRFGLPSPSECDVKALRVGVPPPQQICSDTPALTSAATSLSTHLPLERLCPRARLRAKTERWQVRTWCEGHGATLSGARAAGEALRAGVPGGGLGRPGALQLVPGAFRLRGPGPPATRADGPGRPAHGVPLPALRVATAYRVHSASRHGGLPPAMAAQTLRQTVGEVRAHARLLGMLRRLRWEPERG